MNPIDPAELSAYLDGELDPARAGEVEAALASSPALRGELNALVNADNAWRAAARGASFEPGIRLRPGNTVLRSTLRAAGAIVLLLAARVLPKLPGSLLWELVLNGIAFTFALIWIARMTGAEFRTAGVRTADG